MFEYVWLIVEAHGPWLWVVTQSFPRIVQICSDSLQIRIVSPLGATKSSLQCGAILRNCVSRILSDLGDLLIVFVALRVAERTSQSVAECQDIERCPQLSEAQSEELRKSDETVTSGR